MNSLNRDKPTKNSKKNALETVSYYMDKIYQILYEKHKNGKVYQVNKMGSSIRLVDGKPVVDTIPSLNRDMWEEEFDNKYLKVNGNGTLYWKNEGEVNLQKKQELIFEIKDFISTLLSREKEESYSNGFADGNKFFADKQNEVIELKVKEAKYQEKKSCLKQTVHSFANYLRDHYWDSLEKDRGVITAHIDIVEKNFVDQTISAINNKK